eukprot:1824096-Amphidinium_carterae.1
MHFSVLCECGHGKRHHAVARSQEGEVLGSAKSQLANAVPTNTIALSNTKYYVCHFLVGPQKSEVLSSRDVFERGPRLLAKGRPIARTIQPWVPHVTCYNVQCYTRTHTAGNAPCFISKRAILPFQA